MTFSRGNDIESVVVRNCSNSVQTVRNRVDEHARGLPSPTLLVPRAGTRHRRVSMPHRRRSTLPQLQRRPPNPTRPTPPRDTEFRRASSGRWDAAFSERPHSTPSLRCTSRGFSNGSIPQEPSLPHFVGEEFNRPISLTLRDFAASRHAGGIRTGTPPDERRPAEYRVTPAGDPTCTGCPPAAHPTRAATSGTS